MNKELKDLLAEINAKKAEVRNLVAKGDIEGAKNAKAELQKLSDKFDLLSDIDDDEKDDAEKEIGAGKKKKAAAGGKPSKTEVVRAFVNRIVCGMRKKPMTEEDTEIFNSMTEGAAVDGESDGGFTVPEDIQNDIKTLRRSSDNLETLVNVEPVTTKSGSRVYEKDADTTEWNEVDEEDDFGTENTPKLVKISYAIKKFGGILKVTKELLEDTAANILAFLNKWIAKKTRATRNAKILAAFNTITESGAVTIAGLDDLKDIFNVALDPAIAESACCVTNQDGFNALDKWKDDDGRYLLQRDPIEKTRRLLFGMYPLIVLSNKTLPTTKVYDVADATRVVGYKYPIYCGDPKEAVTLFDREVISIELSTEAGDLWAKDQTGIKVRDRFDVQAVDTSALKKGYVKSGKQTAGGSVSINGTGTVGNALSAVVTGITPSAAQTTLTYKWQRGASATGTFTDIASATASSYTLTNDDATKYIKVVVTVGGTDYQGIFNAVSGAIVAAAG